MVDTSWTAKNIHTHSLPQQNLLRCNIYKLAVIQSPTAWDHISKIDNQHKSHKITIFLKFFCNLQGIFWKLWESKSFAKISECCVQIDGSCENFLNVSSYTLQSIIHFVQHGGQDAAAPCSVPMGLLCSMVAAGWGSSFSGSHVLRLCFVFIVLISHVCLCFVHAQFGTVSCCRLRRALGPSLLLIEVSPLLLCLPIECLMKCMCANACSTVQPTSPVAGASSSRPSCSYPTCFCLLPRVNRPFCCFCDRRVFIACLCVIVLWPLVFCVFHRLYDLFCRCVVRLIKVFFFPFYYICVCFS